MLTEQEVASGQCKFNRTDLKGAEEESMSQSVLGRELTLYLPSELCMLGSEGYGHRKDEAEEEEDLI